MQHSSRRLALAGTAALTLAAVPAFAEPVKISQGTAADLGVMEVSLKDAVQFNWGFQGQTQGAGIPNSIGIGAFAPLVVGSNSVFFIDALVNANLSDLDQSSIVNTDVAGTTISTSTRMGYRWLNRNRSWMLGVNAGYDSRPLTSGNDDTGVAITNLQTAFFQQVATSVEAVSNTWNFNAYALVPIGEAEQRLNSEYLGGALDTYGLDIGYTVTPDMRVTVGYYYQQGDLDEADGSGVRGRIAYNVSNGLTLGANLSYDQVFDIRFSADIKYRFGSNGYGSPKSQQPPVAPVIQSLSSTPANREIRVHDTQSPPPEEVAEPTPVLPPPPLPPETTPPEPI